MAQRKTTFRTPASITNIVLPILEPTELDLAKLAPVDDVPPKDLATGQVQLVQLGHQAARRDIGFLGIIAIGFNVPNSWVAILASFSIAIAAGGPVSLIYGTFISCAFYACAAVTLAELASVYPTAGGQYHFTSILAPEKANRSLAYVCGILSNLSWTINAAGITLIGSQLITAFPQFYNGYIAKQWHLFLLSQALNLFALLYNLFLLKRTNRIHDAAFILTLVTFVVSCITCLARSEKQPSSWVWTKFEANTGWSAGVSFLTGLTTPCYMYGGLDAALHLAEETLNASYAVPRALMATIGIGFLTGFVFSVVMAYCIVDLDSLLGETVPIYPLWRVAMKSDTAGTVFLVAVTVIIVFILIAVQQTSSRLLWSFACDRGVFMSKQLSSLSPSLGSIPANALMFNSILVFICGCLYLGSTTAFNALVNSLLLMQMISFALPAALLIYQKRDSRLLPRNRPFRVPEPVGWFCNIGTVVAATIETVFFSFPTALPVSAGTMNYAVAVLAVIAILAAINWFAHARKHYQGPRVELSL